MDMRNLGTTGFPGNIGKKDSGLADGTGKIGDSFGKTMDAMKNVSLNHYIEDIRIISGKNASAPAEYEKIDVDLNKGAGGDYLYLCYKCGNDANKAINGLDVVIGDNNGVPAPAGFTRVEPDLNKGAGGKYIYLCIRRGADNPIQEIQVVHGSSSSVGAPSGFTKIDKDLNKGAGGDYIYLCYR